MYRLAHLLSFLDSMSSPRAVHVCVLVWVVKVCLIKYHSRRAANNERLDDPAANVLEVSQYCTRNVNRVA